ncbi:MAG TPA: molybdopterin cofactor-binding domain-containing protein [Kofleriaceae bacterium]|nr:molybdopterin cofactor-binding domain-containing protein [Kofleriaceae bacterium]
MERRAFLQLGLAAGGAFVVGCALGPTGSTTWRHYHRTGEFQPNAWIRILPSGAIVFTLDRVEMGQGTTTSHAMLVAEELEVDPRKLQIELAEASRVYDNRDKQIAIQITGGSTSTASSWQPLRDAGAVAREMLRAGAAARWGVPVAECVAHDGTITHARSGRSASYGELAGDAAAQDVPHVRLKEPREFRWIGTSLDRLDLRPKIDGSGIYGIDVQLPGMVTAVIARPPVPGARLASFDERAARARRGVVDVVRLGEAIAVLAVGYWEARRGADDLRATWTGGQPVDTGELHASFARLLDRPGTKVARDVGDARAIAPTIDAIYSVPYLAHATMEPQNATAVIYRSGPTDRCEVWAPTQTAGIARFRVAEAIGFDLEDVAIHTTLIGGGFGRRGLVDYAVEAARVAQRAGRPVKVVWSREDDLEHDWYRPMAVSRLRGSVRPGAITSWRHQLVCQSILADEGGDFAGALVPDATPRAARRVLSDSIPRAFARGMMLDSTAVEGSADLPYAIPNLRVEHTPVEAPVQVGFWRSVGHSHNGFVTEAFFDELAHAAGLDPVAARRALLARAPRHLAVLELAAEKAGWGSPLPPGVGRGVAVHASFKSYCAHVIEASVEGKRVRVHRVVSAVDCGRVVNPQLVVQQIESAVIFALSAALYQRITHRAGRVQETNFGSYRALRMFECPVIETHIVPSSEEPTGIGEPGVPPVAPALVNAIFAATGRRIRTLPIVEAL